MEGYEKVAHLMGSHNDLLILKRFRSLNVQNLLYLQAEILHLEETVKALAKRDASHPDREYFQRDWWSISQGDGENNEQWEVLLTLREKLEKYNDSVFKVAKLANMDHPTGHDLNLLRSWFERPQMGAFPLLGLDRDAWNGDGKDLIALKRPPRQDMLSRWFIQKLVPVLHRCLGQRIKNPVGGELGSELYEYKEATLIKILEVLTTIVASLLPLASVVILYSIQRTSLRLGIIVVLSACFSLALAVMTNARKIEVFAATSAFAAVNVVFLTNSNTCPISTKG